MVEVEPEPQIAEEYKKGLTGKVLIRIMLNFHKFGAHSSVG